MGSFWSSVVLNVGELGKSANYLNRVVKYLGFNLVLRVISLRLVA